MLANGARASEGSLRQFGQLERIVLVTSVASLMKLEPNILYRPSQLNFPLIDFFAVIGNKLAFFLMTVSDSSPSPLDILSNAKLGPLEFSQNRVLAEFYEF